MNLMDLAGQSVEPRDLAHRDSEWRRRSGLYRHVGAPSESPPPGQATSTPIPPDLRCGTGWSPVRWRECVCVWRGRGALEVGVVCVEETGVSRGRGWNGAVQVSPNQGSCYPGLKDVTKCATSIAMRWRDDLVCAEAKKYGEP